MEAFGRGTSFYEYLVVGTREACRGNNDGRGAVWREQEAARYREATII